MAYLTITNILGDSDELLDGYERSEPTMTSVGRDHGLILHAAAKADDGLLVVNLWRSKNHSEAAAADPRRRAVITGHGLGPERFRRSHYEVAHHVLPG